jgi:hypothetical protein
VDSVSPHLKKLVNVYILPPDMVCVDLSGVSEVEACQGLFCYHQWAMNHRRGLVFFTFPEVWALAEAEVSICEHKNPHTNLPATLTQNPLNNNPNQETT